MIKDDPEVTPERIAKLPVWAREHLQRIEQQRDSAVRALQEHTDNQTPSKCYTRNYVCDGQKGRFGGPTDHRAYFNANEQITIEHADIKLDVSFYEDGEITLRYRGDHDVSRDVAIVPVCHNSIKLVNRRNMRS